ncbi:hypothetical protein V6N12_061169 [Hibiscus sabdariffa]|uniref:Uncharacterized protein n=1 Tax=Hibiscus sabdariffa TaxID=183260 RepID=A0ABR2DWA0_9ROSI
MDADSGEGQKEDMHAVDTVNAQSDKGKEESKTYASVAAQSTLHGSSTKSTSAFVEEEVVILDEDVILQRDGKIPSIQFSPCVHDQLAENVVVERVEASLDKEEITADNLFGPWMVVERRRRRSTMDSRLDGDRYAAGSSGGGSRFGPLQEEVAVVSNQQGDALQDAVVNDHQVLQIQQSKLNRDIGISNGPKKNTTYIQSNPEKKKKSIASGPSSVQVIPSLGGKAANSLIHKPRIGTGSHDAIVITEHGIVENGASGSKGRRSRNVGFKSMLGTVGRSLKGRRLVEPRELHDRAMEVGDIRLNDAENVSSDSDSRYNEEHGADMALGVASMAFRSQLRTFVHEQHADVVGLLEPRHIETWIGNSTATIFSSFRFLLLNSLRHFNFRFFSSRSWTLLH